MKFETLVITEAEGVAHIELNRPDKANAFNSTMWKEVRQAFDWLSTSRARVAVLSARGKYFTAGIDLEMLASTHSGISSLPEGKKQECLK
jgi:enoyl-CoA hydratase